MVANVGRAKQFMAFAALRGYYDIVHERERITENKKELGQYEQMCINYKLAQVKKGMIVELKYYNGYKYDHIVGMVSEIDEIFKTITIVRTKIMFSDIIDIQGKEIEEFL